jgi:hypothetical protein
MVAVVRQGAAKVGEVERVSVHVVNLQAQPVVVVPVVGMVHVNTHTHVSPIAQPIASCVKQRWHFWWCVVVVVGVMMMIVVRWGGGGGGRRGCECMAKGQWWRTRCCLFCTQVRKLHALVQTSAVPWHCNT